MNPELIYLITAERVIIERGTDKVSIIGIFQNVTIPKDIDTVIIPITVFARVKNLKGDVVAKIIIYSPDGSELQSAEINGMNTENKPINLSAEFTTVQFSQTGLFSIKIKVKDKELEGNVDEHVISVNKQV